MAMYPLWKKNDYLSPMIMITAESISIESQTQYIIDNGDDDGNVSFVNMGFGQLVSWMLITMM